MYRSFCCTYTGAEYRTLHSTVCSIEQCEIPHSQLRSSSSGSPPIGIGGGLNTWGDGCSPGLIRSSEILKCSLAMVAWCPTRSPACLQPRWVRRERLAPSKPGSMQTLRSATRSSTAVCGDDWGSRTGSSPAPCLSVHYPHLLTCVYQVAFFQLSTLSSSSVLRVVIRERQS